MQQGRLHVFRFCYVRFDFSGLILYNQTHLTHRRTIRNAILCQTSIPSFEPVIAYGQRLCSLQQSTRDKSAHF